ncbi:hypothetical protein IEQ44_08950 [Nocardioides sp. Y6]|uniref:DUF2207 domain-containing protein n=1 Tax=Nocardioides malaquae TaxID=2773426 RepID=A0ABR9RUH5_9ACTN|nr:hypothetical protein [Nocardioides malaquae]
MSLFLTTVGLLLVVIGGASATFVGPDDTLVIGEKRVPERAAGLAVRTNPAITKFVNIDLLVRAEAEGGVFLATSHRVDTDSLLGGRRYYEITRMSLGDVGGVVTEGPRATRRTLRPARITGWLDRTTGSPEAELVVPLDGTPLDVVAVPRRARDRVTFTIGATVQGAFWIQVTVAVTGLLMLLAGWGLRRFGRSRSQSAASTDDDAPSDPPEGRDRPASGSPASGAPASGSPSGSLSLPRYPRGMTSDAATPSTAPIVAAPAVAAPAIAAPVIASALLASGATATPTPAEPAADASAPGGADAERKPQWDKRKIILLAVLVPLSFALKGCAVPGAAPETDRVETRTGMTLTEGQELEPDATHVYAPEFVSYPMWALIASGEPRRLRLVTRNRFADRWQTEATVRVRGPLPSTVERAIEPNAALVRRGDEVAWAVQGWWESGEITGVRLDRRTRRIRERLLADGIPVWSIDVAAPPTGTPPVRLVEVAGGHLAVLRHTVVVPGARLRLTTVAHLPTAGRPRLLGTSLAEVS